MISTDELKEGYLYLIRARNARIGIWKPQSNGFIILRQKFQDWFLFEEYHWDIGAPFGTVRPEKKLEESPFKGDDLIVRTLETDRGEKYYSYPKYVEIIEYLKDKMEEYRSFFI